MGPGTRIRNDVIFPSLGKSYAVEPPYNESVGTLGRGCLASSNLLNFLDSGSILNIPGPILNISGSVLGIYGSILSLNYVSQ